jgi:hypothetical protein
VVHFELDSTDANQIMKCSFVDVSTEEKMEVDISLSASENVDIEQFNKFIVE